MSSYYEVLQVSPTVTIDAIQAAYEQRYNHWRRLVTHHEPAVVERANKALRILEKVHQTLSDPEQRAAYDASISAESIGGLADPQVAPQPRTVLPTTPRFVPPRTRSAHLSVENKLLDAWLCPQCGAASLIGTRFCKGCGHSIGHDCPQCGQLIEAAAPFCAHCGADIPKVEKLKRRQEEQVAKERAVKKAEAQRQQAKQQELEPLGKFSRQAIIWVVVGWVAFPLFPLGIIPFVVAIVQARRALNLPQRPSSASYRKQARVALWGSVISLVLTVIIFGMVLVGNI